MSKRMDTSQPTQVVITVPAVTRAMVQWMHENNAPIRIETPYGDIVFSLVSTVSGQDDIEKALRNLRPGEALRFINLESEQK